MSGPADVPAWGTPPDAGPREFLVTGFYNENGQTWWFTVLADDARQAEDLVMAEEVEQAGEPIATHVLTVEDGAIVNHRQRYAQYLLLDDARNKRTS